MRRKILLCFLWWVSFFIFCQGRIIHEGRAMVGRNSIRHFYSGDCLWGRLLGLSTSWIWLICWSMLLAICSYFTFSRLVFTSFFFFQFYRMSPMGHFFLLNLAKKCILKDLLLIFLSNILNLISEILKF